jgi:nucleosome binding factor SPN SPT16 subunit
MSLNWANIMRTINDDPEAFFEDGGWNFLSAESDEDEGNDVESDESSFHASDDETSASSDEDEEEEEEGVSEEESGYLYFLDWV